jgi:hypothetical protein
MRIALPDNRDRRAWQAAVWDASGEELSGPQTLEFVRLLELPYDPDEGGLDPFPVVRDLLAHRHLWTATRVVTAYPFLLRKAPPPNWPRYPDLVELFELGAGHWRPDTLYLLHELARREELSQLVDNWSPSEVGVDDYESYGGLYDVLGLGDTYGVFRLRWD